jgi:hypothetical protein
MTRPFIEIVTRHWPTPRRQGLLARQQASLAALTEKDWVQTLLIDPHGRGIGASHLRLRDFEPHGRYVYVLDDDDVCALPDLLHHARLCVPADLIVMRMRHADWGILPGPQHWEREPLQLATVGPACVLIEAELWRQTRQHWTEDYAGDFAFLSAAYEAAETPVWHDVIAAEVPAVNQGAP